MTKITTATKEEYEAAKPLKFPLIPKRHPEYTMSSLAIECPECLSTLQDLRGELTEHENCVDVSGMGHCKKCSAVAPVRWRWYPEQNRFMSIEGHKWKEHRLVTPLFKNIQYFFRKFLTKLRG